MSVFVIAEAGVNHNGSLQMAKRLVEEAKEAGADAVKFQLFNSQKLWGDDRIKHLELRFADMAKLADHCNLAGIEFMCTPFGVEELIFLKPLLKRVKIASGCIARLPLLDAVAETGLPAILSTGMSGFGDIDLALKCLGRNVTLLHCTSAYPCHLEDVNLSAMDDWQSNTSCRLATPIIRTASRLP
jgi:N,N'-diacetyllegionaminate synthase